MENHEGPTKGEMEQHMIDAGVRRIKRLEGQDTPEEVSGEADEDLMGFVDKEEFERLIGRKPRKETA